MRRSLRHLLFIAAAVLVGIGGSAATTLGASTSATTVVTAEVLSATNLNTAACAPDDPDVTDFGQLLPGTKNVTTTNCAVVFGSSNDTSMLRAYQSDRVGSAMWKFADGVAMDTGFHVDGWNRESADAGATDVDVNDAAYTLDGGIVVAMGGANGRQTLIKFDAAGDPDPTFGAANGILTWRPQGVGTQDETYDVDVLPDGSIVATGTSWHGVNGIQANMTKITAAGVIDTTWGTNGFFLHNFGAPGVHYSNGVLARSDGGFIIAGFSTAPASDLEMVAVTPDGQLDTSWGTAGEFTYDACFTNEWMRSTIILDDDSIIFSARNGPCGIDRLLIGKVTPSGSLDTAFSNGDDAVDGILYTRGVGLNNEFYEPGQIAEDRQGRIWVTASNVNAGPNTGSIIRVQANGLIDNSFDGDGRVQVTNGDGDQSPNEIVILPNDDVMIGMRAVDAGTNRAVVFHINEDATIDTDWGTNGYWVGTYPGSDAHPAGMALGADGRLMIAGETDNAGTAYAFAAVVDGTPVSNFLDGTNDWDDSVSPNDVHFGACLVSVAGTGTPAAAAPWTPTGTCAAVDADPWNEIDADGVGGSSKIMADTASGSTDATANLRFGFRTADDQPAGIYMAPITFEAVAPNV